ncbi:DNA-methyltransferase [Tunicatimonas pelagia]|uniref:DNA-methyltransferase n=1 Tax=Tunicatimonas pelagia TaxID=931531 RepID=UPI00266685C9|nr:site-specific DNA-methyltransferase [Tunicatimonas pelagia]WKN41171.1 site-specific DNA-methyltransferase [Tunicatimonas pelagia]
MSTSTQSKPYKIYNQSCYGLEGISDDSIDAIITDPPYGIGFQAHEWDKALPERQIWKDCYRVLKPGGYALVFSSIRLMHHLMLDLEKSGFRIKDVLMWAFLNGMPKSRDVGLDIDKELEVESTKVGTYNYVQGYKKGGADNYYAGKKKYRYEPASEEGKYYQGWGMGIKPCYEPIIMVQKPLPNGVNVAQNMLEHGTGALNLEDTRMPYEEGEGKVGHNPHSKGRVTGNVLRTFPFKDGYDKFFLVPKVRQHAEEYNYHPTKKPVELMEHLIKLITHEKSTVLDPFTGSGSTGVACVYLHRSFVGYEMDKGYSEIAKNRLLAAYKGGKQQDMF